MEFFTAITPTVHRQWCSLLLLFLLITTCSTAVIKNRTDIPSGGLAISDGVTKLRLLPSSQPSETDWVPLTAQAAISANQSLSETVSLDSVDSPVEVLHTVANNEKALNTTTIEEVAKNSTSVEKTTIAIGEIEEDPIKTESAKGNTTLDITSTTSSKNLLEDAIEKDIENITNNNYETSPTLDIASTTLKPSNVSDSATTVSPYGPAVPVHEKTNNLLELEPTANSLPDQPLSENSSYYSVVHENQEKADLKLNSTQEVSTSGPQIPAPTQMTNNTIVAKQLTDWASVMDHSAAEDDVEPIPNKGTEKSEIESSQENQIPTAESTERAYSMKESSGVTNITELSPTIPSSTPESTSTKIQAGVTNITEISSTIPSSTPESRSTNIQTIKTEDDVSSVTLETSKETTVVFTPPEEKPSINEVTDEVLTDNVSSAPSGFEFTPRQVKVNQTENSSQLETKKNKIKEVPQSKEVPEAETKNSTQAESTSMVIEETSKEQLYVKSNKTGNTTQTELPQHSNTKVIQQKKMNIIDDVEQTTTMESVTIESSTMDPLDNEATTAQIDEETLPFDEEGNDEAMITTTFSPPPISTSTTKTTTPTPETTLGSLDDVEMIDHIQTTQIVEESTTTDLFKHVTPPIAVDAPIIPTQTVFGNINKIENDVPVTEKKALLPTYPSTSTKQADEVPIEDMSTLADEEETDVNAIIAIVVSCVGVVCLLLIIGFFIVMRKRQKLLTYTQRCRPVGLDAYSLDNVSVFNSVRRKGHGRQSKRAYGNAAFEDPYLKKHPLTTAALAAFVTARPEIYAEFKDLPIISARIEDVPDGCEDKNRYANVVPLPESRCFLQRIGNDPTTEYINANFARGPRDNANYYIATQAPLESTCADFWRMIWEQNSRVIIMATDLNENGIERCAEYLPPSVVLDNTVLFGDFQVTLKAREVKNKYAVSSLHLRNGATNTWREITHFWYQWPDDKTTAPVPEKASIVSMLLEARTYLKYTLADQVDEIDSSNGGELKVEELDRSKSLPRHQGPLTVHCSPGTGRTGTLIACDIALRELELPHPSIDVPRIVYFVRTGRANAVATREQYEFIYEVAHLYATKLAGPHHPEN